MSYQFDPDVAGCLYYCTDRGYKYEPNGVGYKFRQVYVNAEQELGNVRLTGFFLNYNNAIYAQETSGYFVKANAQSYKVSEATAQYSSNTVYNVINKLIQNNKRILENNLLCARFSNRLTTSQQQTLYDLQERLENRNTALRNNEVISNVTLSSPTGWNVWSGHLDSFMKAGRVGSVTVSIVVAVIVIASLVSAAYWAYKYFYEESEKDVKYSDELTKILTEKLTAEEYAQLKSETAGMITKAKLSSRFSSWGSKLLYAGLGFAGLFVISKISSNNLRC